ncbi:receptor-type tyrosine-protein phosphatase zeta [Planoprotostelium fungivorum]|uniref:Receptor-type tyrosine-protein phosphatase zeta n=1 Tax=Planoprotostelium fungivorum TaxID=1890364 RepID=A0A2P6MP29_9EUKA|nr:receptor-type tyrosine-protein phosphatase zeta [Planoprotostelium fungivorum]
MQDTSKSNKSSKLNAHSSPLKNAANRGCDSADPISGTDDLTTKMHGGPLKRKDASNTPNKRSRLNISQYQERIQLNNEFGQMHQVLQQMDQNVFIPDPAATNTENMHKNRYKNVLPNNHTRVEIEMKNGRGKYINANHVQDKQTKETQKYICCQAPLKDTINDFWTMMWEQRSPVIVMLSNGEKESGGYWPPTEGAIRLYGFVMVTMNKIRVCTNAKLKEKMSQITNLMKRRESHSSFKSTSSIFARPMTFDIRGQGSFLASSGSLSDFTRSWSKSLHSQNSSSLKDHSGAMIIRRMTLYDVRDPTRTSRVVHQIHYTQWPDQGIPQDTEQIMAVMRELDIRKKGLSQPIVVHCSAGIGRTGAFVAIHMSVQQVALGYEKMVDLFDLVVRLRMQRNGMVQTEDQYKYMHITLRDILMDKYTNLTATTRGRNILKTSLRQVNTVKGVIEDFQQKRLRRSASEPTLENWTRIMEDSEMMAKMKIL